MAAGLPLLATRCGGYEELVTDEENGWLVDVDNAEAIARAIQELKVKTEIRSDVGLKAQRHVQQTFDSKMMFEHYQNIYEQHLTY